MSGKSDSLIRDLAALFVKYRPADWEPIISELEERRGSPRIAEAIRVLANQKQTQSAKRPKTPKPKVSRSVETAVEPRFSGPHAATVERLRDEFVSKRMMPSITALRSAYTALGIKTAMPKRREGFVAAITEHLDGLEPSTFERALLTVAREADRSGPADTRDYDRWFELITAERQKSGQR